MNLRLKNIILNKLNDDLSKVEIILSENQSIWFIDRANKYWYFELEKSGKLWWRYEFFTDFFTLFCLEVNEFQPLLSEWVEGILNRGVITSVEVGARWSGVTEGVIRNGYRKGSRKVEEVINRSEDTNIEGRCNKPRQVDKVLNRGINETIGTTIRDTNQINQMMTHKVVSILPANEENEFIQQILVNELIYEVESASPLDTPASDSVDQVLTYKVNRTIPDMSKSLVEVQRLLDSNQ